MTQTNATTAAAKPELFQDHLVKDGKVQKTWTDTLLFRDTSSIQKAYDEKAKDTASDSFTWKTPFTWGYNILATVGNAIVDAFKTILSLCFDFSEGEVVEDAAKETAKPAVKN